MRQVLMAAVRIAMLYGTGGSGTGRALRDVTMQVRVGDLLAVLGPPGSGKTTLLRILGLLDRPTAGDLFFQGRLVTGLSDPEMAELRGGAIRYVPPACTALPPAGLILADEPTPDLLQRLCERTRCGETAVFATADPEMAAHGTILYVLRDGVLRQMECERRA